MTTRCAIAGVGITPFGKNPEATVRTLAESAVKQAMQDAGLINEDQCALVKPYEKAMGIEIKK